MEIEQVTTGNPGDGGSSVDAKNVEVCLSGQGDDHVAGTMYLVWQDLTVVLPNFGNGPTRRLLDGLNGYAEPGKIMAIMGPSGSGKSTLLDTLAGIMSDTLNLVEVAKAIRHRNEAPEKVGENCFFTFCLSELGTVPHLKTYKRNTIRKEQINMSQKVEKDYKPIVKAPIMEYDCLADYGAINESIKMEARAFSRLSGNLVMAGSIFINGKKIRQDHNGVAYVTQENTMLGTLTVRETIAYSAHLRLPSRMTKEEIDGVVEGTITEMGLQDCADRVIGNWHLRGISGGEKKRLSIALETIVRPHLLFLDEPTSGLDSASAFFVIQILKSFACDGRTVVSSIHQPSGEVFALFDNLILLSGGETVYFGEAKMALQFFAEAGFPCPRRRNPSDHFLRCINSDFDLVTATLTEYSRVIQMPSDSFENLPAAQIKAMLVKQYRFSNHAVRSRARIQEILAIKGLAINRENDNQVNWWKQLSVLTRRSFLNMWRDIGYYWIRIGVYVALSLCVGTIFYNVGRGYTAIFARRACGGFVSGFMTFMSIGGFQSFIEELKVFHKERLNQHYGIGLYVLSNFLSSFPYLTVMSIATASIVYYMVKFRSEFSHFLYISLDLISAIAAVESCMMTIASLVPNFLMGVIIGAGYIGILMATSGFFEPMPILPKVFWRYPVSYINYGAWGLEGAYKNDMIGLEFDPLVPGGPKLKGEIILTNMLGINVDYSKWWDLAAMVVIVIAFRILFYAILKFKERTLPVFRTFYSKRTLHHLKKRPSFRKNLPFPSKRHNQTLHPLSFQEGLNSTMH